MFFDAVFELADLHTMSTMAEEYVAFLDRLLRDMDKPIVRADSQLTGEASHASLPEL